MSLAFALGIIASVLTGCKLAWIFRGTKQEDRATIDPLPWMIWSVLGVVTLLPQLAKAGWEWTMLFGCANLAVNVVVIWLAREHDLSRPTRGDLIAISVAAVGILLWLVSGDAFYGLWFCLVADSVGVVRIWLKAWRDPEHELVTTWLFGACGAAFAFASALYAREPIVVWYPAYVIGNALASAAIIAARRFYLRRQSAAIAAQAA